MCHLPPFTELWSPKEGYNGEQFVRDEWVPVFERYDVDIVISGHTHAYARGFKKSVLYAIVGGSGGMVDTDRVHDWKMFDVTIKSHHFVIMDVQDCKLTWKVYNEYKERIDQIVLDTKSKHPNCKK